MCLTLLREDLRVSLRIDLISHNTAVRSNTTTDSAEGVCSTFKDCLKYDPEDLKKD
jgi:hypothetical protein